MNEPPIPDPDRKLPFMSTQDTGVPPSAFGRLPDEIIEQILLVTDPNSFASLILLNSHWRRVSQQAHLYAHHLALCPATHDAKLSPASASDDDLPRLRRHFAQQVKRNLFDAFARPKITNITLVSNAISSSSAPGGDGLQFSHSQRGHHLLAYNSSRIYVLDVQASEMQVKREFKILRRPAAVCILDDGSLLAVLSTDMQVDLYDLTQTPPRRKQSIVLDHAPRTIALSPCGSVLAAAYVGGIEVQSIATGALPTERRAVKCDAVDSLAFSFDGTQLLGTTSTSQSPNTVILTAPYYDPGAQMADSNVSAMWTTSILFPNTTRDCSHAVLLQESSSTEAEWAFTYDRSFETFRAVRIDDLRNGTTYFPGPVPNVTNAGAIVPSTLPAANLGGQLVSAGFENKDVWVYGVPEDLEAVLEAPAGSSISAGGLTRGLSNRSLTRQQESQSGRVPQWQALRDNLRNHFVRGRKVGELQGIGTIKWVSHATSGSLRERLVVCAKGAQPPKPITEEDDIDFVDGGRVTIIDFDYSLEHGDTEEITIDVGTQQAEVLEEEQRDLATEVAIVRRRTVAQQRHGAGGSTRAVIAARPLSGSNLRLPISDPKQDEEDPLVPRRMATARDTHQETEDIEDATLEEVQEALDAPYAHADPRSVSSLRRAATAAAITRDRVPRAAATGHVEYRRADGRREHPHESDADNWVPPPPPYSKDDPGDTPSFLRHAAIPGVGIGPQQEKEQQDSSVPQVPPVPLLPQNVSVASRQDLPRLDTSPTRERPISLTDTSSASQTRSAAATAASTDPSTGTSSHGQQLLSVASPRQRLPLPEPAEPDIYDVSPPRSPPLAASGVSPQTPGSQPSVVSGMQSSPRLRRAAPQLSIDAGSFPKLECQNNEAEAHVSSVSRFRRLSSSLTWPRAPQPPHAQERPQGGAPATFPLSAPARTIHDEESLRAAPPPLPRPDQVYSLHNRDGSVPHRRASGMFLSAATELTAERAVPQLTHHASFPMVNVSGISQQASRIPDQPLIISTPQGVSGAFDNPSAQGQHEQQEQGSDGPIIHAPIARHPYPVPGSLTRGSTAERLETIYNPSTVAVPGQEGAAPCTGNQPLTASSLRYHTSMTRRESRARRSAVRNMQDAKGRGWTGSSGGGKKSGKTKRKSKKTNDDDDAASNGGWTDVTWATTTRASPRGGPGQGASNKSKKCVVM